MKKFSRVKLNEPIQVIEFSFGFFPKTFVWKDTTYTIIAVFSCQTISHRLLFWKVERYCFTIRCAEGTFEIYQNLKDSSWHIASFAPTAAAPATDAEKA